MFYSSRTTVERIWFDFIVLLSVLNQSELNLKIEMETILEQQRRYHEERERLMDAMVKEMLHKKAGHRENINSEHRLKMLLDQFMDSTMHLQDLYEDKDGQRKEEVCWFKILNITVYI